MTGKHETKKPCPFCGEQDDLELGTGTKDRDGTPVYLSCVTCGAQGPWVYEESDDSYHQFCSALHHWNIRVTWLDNTTSKGEDE